MGDVMETAVLGKESISQAIENNDAFKEIFNSQVQRIVSSPVRGERVRNLQASKIRFASSQKPLGRMIIFFDAVWSTIEIIVTTKDGAKPKRITQHFIEWVTEEKLLCLGMMADAGDCTFEVTRFHDAGNADLSQVVEHLVRYVETLDFFSCNGHA